MAFRARLSLGKQPFIAVNLLPPLSQNKEEALALLTAQIEKAIALGFTHAWLNPISLGTAKRTCDRYSLDTGVNTTLFNSLYAPDDPTVISEVFLPELKDLLKTYQEKHFLILADFVWKHVGNSSDLIRRCPAWFKEKPIKDVTEYDFDHASEETFQQIIQHLQQTIDAYLDSKKGLGFAGLRIDAASHLNPKTRRALYEYIREKYPTAIIFEEVLFARNQEETIKSLVRDAEDSQKPCIFSDFVTSNLYYQHPDAFGALPRPSEMGDADKLRLAQNRGISFTGNHDHFSLGWGIILFMAAQRAHQDTGLMAFLEQEKLKVSPIKKDAYTGHHSLSHARAMIEKIAKRELTVESLGEIGGPSCIKVLLSYANEIVLELLGLAPAKSPQLFAAFKKEFFETLVNRTLASPSGYFFLFCEIDSLFKTQRIFTNKRHQALVLPWLTAQDVFLEKKATETIITLMESEPAEGKRGDRSPKKTKEKAPTKKYDNIGPFKTAAPLKTEMVARFWLPYIIDYLMDNPQNNFYARYEDPSVVEKAEKTLLQTMAVEDFIKNINQLYQALETKDCTDYHTFTALEKIKIVVRCSEKATDIILVNLDPQHKIAIGDMDIEKIALWYQARRYPVREAMQHAGVHGDATLKSPGDDKEISYYDGWYSGYWQQKDASGFDFSYHRMVGDAAGHQTNLYVGNGLEVSLQEHTQIAIKIQPEKTQEEKDSDSFHNTETQVTRAPAIKKPAAFVMFTDAPVEGKASDSTSEIHVRVGSKGEKR